MRKMIADHSGLGERAHRCRDALKDVLESVFEDRNVRPNFPLPVLVVCIHVCDEFALQAQPAVAVTPKLLVLAPDPRLALFVFNIVAVVPYPDLTDAGIKDHVLWGALLLVTLFYGPGKLALDRWINKRSHA